MVGGGFHFRETGVRVTAHYGLSLTMLLSAAKRRLEEGS